ncbi:hypothetical protein [Salinibaculum rarum]|uniref:hypothetical protein n=1 Tax=Salinibaculum rarum TaxID=3058903 RepID=UPI00265F028B|nr:hypothetical protein [Salinibaculum sp. KK48]
MPTDAVTSAVDQKKLLWGLKRLALWGELDAADGADPHVRFEAKCHAKTAFEECWSGEVEECDDHGVSPS